MAMLVTTFAVNYKVQGLFIYLQHLHNLIHFKQGHPFMESLTENKALLYSLMTSGGAIICLTCGILPDVSAQFELEELTPEVPQSPLLLNLYSSLLIFYPQFRYIVMTTLATDFLSCFLIDKLLEAVLGPGGIGS